MLTPSVLQTHTHTRKYTTTHSATESTHTTFRPVHQKHSRNPGFSERRVRGRSHLMTDLRKKCVETEVTKRKTTCEIKKYFSDPFRRNYMLYYLPFLTDKDRLDRGFVSISFVSFMRRNSCSFHFLRTHFFIQTG